MDLDLLLLPFILPVSKFFSFTHFAFASFLPFPPNYSGLFRIVVAFVYLKIILGNFARVLGNCIDSFAFNVGDR